MIINFSFFFETKLFDNALYISTIESRFLSKSVSIIVVAIQDKLYMT